MMTLEQIIAIAFTNREDIAYEMEDAFSDTVDYSFKGKYYPATMYEPEEYPDIEVLGYSDYVDRAIQAIIGIFGDNWSEKEEQTVIDNVAKIMSEIDVDFLSEDAYFDKGFEDAIDVYWERVEEKRAQAEDAYYERLMDSRRYND